jgi:hypothetical protein
MPQAIAALMSAMLPAFGGASSRVTGRAARTMSCSRRRQISFSEKTALHRLDQADVLALHLGIDSHIEPARGPQPPVAAGQPEQSHAHARAFRRQWDDLEIVHHLRIDVEGEVGQQGVVAPAVRQLLVQVRRRRPQPLIVPLAPVARVLVAQPAEGAADVAIQRLDLVAVAEQPEQPGMADRHVVALQVVVHHVLPVDGDVDLPALSQRHHLGAAIGRELPCIGCHPLGHARPAAGEAHERKAEIDLQLQRLQPQLRLVEARKAALAGHRLEPAVEAVGPAVIEAADRVLARSRLPVHHSRGAMPADIVEGAQGPVLAADDESAFAQKIERGEIAGLPHLADVAHQVPIVQQQVPFLQLEELGAMIGPAGQCLAEPLRLVRDLDLSLQQSRHHLSPLSEA